jgi:phosphoribulokinase
MIPWLNASIRRLITPFLKTSMPFFAKAVPLLTSQSWVVIFSIGRDGVDVPSQVRLHRGKIWQRQRIVYFADFLDWLAFELLKAKLVAVKKLTERNGTFLPANSSTEVTQGFHSRESKCH